MLDVGCGNKKRIGFIGIDINPETDADIICDLNKFPYPFKESTFDEIYVDNVLEHLDDIKNVMSEIYRISKPGGSVIIKVPYFRSRYAFIDQTHKHFFTTQSFTYFSPTHIHHRLYNYYIGTFETTAIRFNENFPLKWYNKIWLLFIIICNRYPEYYDHHLGHIFPLDELTFYLKTIKSNGDSK
jgi:predicted SAM-dependent methyltransferase